jgi:hypothetical protein
MHHCDKAHQPRPTIGLNTPETAHRTGNAEKILCYLLSTATEDEKQCIAHSPTEGVRTSWVQLIATVRLMISLLRRHLGSPVKVYVTAAAGRADVTCVYASYLLALAKQIADETNRKYTIFDRCLFFFMCSAFSSCAIAQVHGFTEALRAMSITAAIAVHSTAIKKTLCAHWRSLEHVLLVIPCVVVGDISPGACVAWGVCTHVTCILQRGRARTGLTSEQLLASNTSHSRA